MSNSPSKILVMQAPSADITRLKTNVKNVHDYREFFKQQAVISATNLFTVATNAIQTHNLKQTVILSQVPRNDTLQTDPLRIKKELSQLYNDTLLQLKRSSPFSSYISLVNHRLECPTGGAYAARYRSRRRYDGVHLYGPSGAKAYTESFLCMLRDLNLVKNPPPKFYRRYHLQNLVQSNNVMVGNRRLYSQASHYEIPISNRFDILQSENY